MLNLSERKLSKFEGIEDNQVNGSVNSAVRSWKSKILNKYSGSEQASIGQSRQGGVKSIDKDNQKFLA